MAGPGFAPGADLGILHIDRTRIDPAVLDGLDPGLRVLNRRVLDISKRRHSTLALAPGDNWGGPVIVKSDRNHFGRPERRTLPLPQRLMTEARARLARLNWRLVRTLPDGAYPVLPGIEAVPPWVWADPALLVERFMPEREGAHFVLRIWMFLGARSYGVRMVAGDPLVKLRSQISHEFTTEVPPELEQLRQHHGFDYGKFDYVIHDGKPVVLDMNRTPTIARLRRTPRTELLASGIESFL